MRTNLQGAEMANVRLDNASVVSVDLRGANLQDADLYHALVANTDLTGADLSGANVEDATWCESTCPDGPSSNQDMSMGLTCSGHPGPP